MFSLNISKAFPPFTIKDKENTLLNAVLLIF